MPEPEGFLLEMYLHVNQYVTELVYRGGRPTFYLNVLTEFVFSHVSQTWYDNILDIPIAICLL